MSTITKQWLQKAISQHESMRDEIPFGLDEDDSNTLAALSIALASLEAEPVCYLTWHQGFRAPDDCEEYVVEAKPGDKSCDGSPAFPMYAAPPAPVSVPDEWNKSLQEMVDAMRQYEMDVDEDAPHKHRAMMRRAEELLEKRAAMLQGAEPVTTANKLLDEFDFERFNDVVWLEAVASNPHMHSPTTSTIAMVALELNKRLGAGNSPVITDGWVSCSERMPEREIDVQVYCSDKNEQMVGYMERNERDGYFRFSSLPNGVGIYCQPTHWIPLPAAPQQGVKP